ncbi:MAG: hypothetical protein ABJC89_04905 [Acidobacteriota bacterium]
MVASSLTDVVVEVGDMPVRLITRNAELAALLQQRYAGFLGSTAACAGEFEISVVRPGEFDVEADLDVRVQGDTWSFARGDFRAEWDTRTCRGWIEQAVNPYSVDAVLRILHTLLLAPLGGFLLHAASGIRAGRASIFTGQSGAGKTTIARLAPAEVMLLTDEVSYVRKVDGRYLAFGTPFAGELGTSGMRVSAPVHAVYQLAQGERHHMERLATSDAVRTLMKNILFFADDNELTGQVLATACDVAASVPVYRLTFAADASVWDFIV